MLKSKNSAKTSVTQVERNELKVLKKKHEAAVDAESVSRRQGGERFSVLYGAPLPTSPESPNILRLMLMALGLGLGLSAAMVVGREFMDRSVYDAGALQNEFELPVLGEIPTIHRAV